MAAIPLTVQDFSYPQQYLHHPQHQVSSPSLEEGRTHPFHLFSFLLLGSRIWSSDPKVSQEDGRSQLGTSRDKVSPEISKRKRGRKGRKLEENDVRREGGEEIVPEPDMFILVWFESQRRLPPQSLLAHR